MIVIITPLLLLSLIIASLLPWLTLMTFPRTTGLMMCLIVTSIPSSCTKVVLPPFNQLTFTSLAHSPFLSPCHLPVCLVFSRSSLSWSDRIPADQPSPLHLHLRLPRWQRFLIALHLFLARLPHKLACSVQSTRLSIFSKLRSLP